MKAGKLKLIFVLVFYLTLLVFFASPIFPKSNISLNLSNLKTADTQEKIIINGNWTDAQTAGICSGDGTPGNPYTIRDKDIEGDGVGNCITITNAYEYFTIENCTIHGSGNLLDDSGIYLVNVSNGIINKNGITGNRYGILIMNASNINITYNIIGNERGLKYRFKCSDMWLYLNSFTSSFYELYFEDVNSITFNTPTQFLYTYHGHNYTNYLGNYWSGKLDEFRDDNNDGVTDVPAIYTGGTVNFTRYEVHHHALMEPHINYILIAPYFPPESKIPGYNIFALGVLIAFTSLILLKRHKK